MNGKAKSGIYHCGSTLPKCKLVLASDPPEADCGLAAPESEFRTRRVIRPKACRNHCPEPLARVRQKSDNILETAS